jgi:hypothetical protein
MFEKTFKSVNGAARSNLSKRVYKPANFGTFLIPGGWIFPSFPRFRLILEGAGSSSLFLS